MGISVEEGKKIQGLCRAPGRSRYQCLSGLELATHRGLVWWLRIGPDIGDYHA